MSNPRVLIQVRGGVAHIIAEPGVEVLVLDYDADRVAALVCDANGQMCVASIHTAEEQVDTGELNAQFKHLGD